MISSASLRDINPNRPVVLNTYDDAVTLVRVMLEDAGVLKQAEPEPYATQPEYMTADAKKLMAEKGYHCTSSAAFAKLMEEHQVEPVKRGRVNWYPAARLQAIPGRHVITPTE